MRGRVLVAGVGNVFFGDDGFGVEVVRRLRDAPLPAGARAADFGVRGLHLARALLEPLELVIVAQITPRGAPPGSLHVIDPVADPDSPEECSLDVPLVLAAVRAFGGALPRVWVIGCEPADLGAKVGLSPAVRGAVEPAAELTRELIAQA